MNHYHFHSSLKLTEGSTVNLKKLGLGVSEEKSLLMSDVDGRTADK